MSKQKTTEFVWNFTKDKKSKPLTKVPCTCGNTLQIKLPLYNQGYLLFCNNCQSKYKVQNKQGHLNVEALKQ